MTATETYERQAPPTHGTSRMAWSRVAAVCLGITVLLTLLLTAFTWPSSELEPRSLPVTVVGSTEATIGIRDQLASAGDNDFDVQTDDDRAAAVSVIENREVYGAIVVDDDEAEVLVASAASPAVAQLLSQSATELAKRGPVTVTDVVPTSHDDPRGAVFTAGTLPLAIGGIMVGAVASVALRRTRERLLAVTVVALGSGLAIAGVLQGWLGALSGSYAANAGVVCIGVLAVALPIVGLRRVIGPAAIGVIALLILLVGNPFSGAASAPELVPLGWLGQALPPGAVVSALRSTAYFDGAGAVLPVAVLLLWCGFGLTMAAMPRRTPQLAAVAPGSS
jgi:hypothetical protein